METKLQLRAHFEPYCRWRREEHQDFLEVHLNGFKKHKLHIYINDEGEVMISGRREKKLESLCKKIKVLCSDCTNVDSFCEIFKVSTDFNRDGIEATLSNGILYLKMPKRTYWYSLQNQIKAAAKTLKLGVDGVLVLLAAVEAFVFCKYRQCFLC